MSISLFVLDIRRLMILILAWVVVSGCERIVALETEEDPLIQLDASFIAGEPMPTIYIRRTYGISGTQPFRVQPDDLWAGGARVKLHRNGSSVLLHEVEVGRFVAVDQTPVEQGDVFVANVRWTDQHATATATVPTVNFSGFNMVVGTPQLVGEVVVVGEHSGRRDTLNHFRSDVTIHAGFFGDVQLLLVTSASELSLRGNPEQISQSGLRYTTIYRAESKSETLRLERPVSIVRPAGVADVGREEIILSILVPESIYGDYMRARSDFFSPVTVTNVVGGVGLFIGAASIYWVAETGE